MLPDTSMQRRFHPDQSGGATPSTSRTYQHAPCAYHISHTPTCTTCQISRHRPPGHPPARCEKLFLDGPVAGRQTLLRAAGKRDTAAEEARGSAAAVAAKTLRTWSSKPLVRQMVHTAGRRRQSMRACWKRTGRRPRSFIFEPCRRIGVGNALRKTEAGVQGRESDVSANAKTVPKLVLHQERTTEPGRVDLRLQRTSTSGISTQVREHPER